MKILHLMLISGVTKQFTTDTIPEIPFLTTIKISNMKKNLSEEGFIHGYNVEDQVFEIHNQNFDIFSNNSIFFKTSLFLDCLTEIDHTLVMLQIFYDKIKFSVSYFTITKNKSFLTSMLIEDNTSKQTTKRSYQKISLNRSKFLCFLLMQNDKKDRPFKFNVYVRLTAIFSMMIVVYINFFQKKPLFLQKFLLTNYELKTNEKRKHKNVLIFVIFFINSFQLFYDDNLTLTITNSNDFSEIDQYKNNTKFIYISEGIYTIPSGAFSEWPSVISVNFGNSISDIGNYAFSTCSHLETIIFGENVTTIGDSAFSSCSSIKNITIPNSVTTIGSYAFSFCSNLMILTLGYGITEIGGSAFGDCKALECIYYYGSNEPNIEENAFSNVTTTVITYPTYINKTFGTLSVKDKSAEGNCESIPTLSFSSSHTFSRSNTYSQSNTFSCSDTYSQSNTFNRSNTYSQSNTFTESFQSDLTLLYSYTLTYTLTIAYSFTYYETQTRSLSLFIFNSTFSYVETEFLYYDYTVIMYSTHFNYYSNFITMFRTNILHTNGLTTNALIGIVCGSIALVLIIVGIVIFLIKSNNKKGKSTSTLQFKDSTTSSLNQKEDVNTLVEDIVKEDEDNWL